MIQYMVSCKNKSFMISATKFKVTEGTLFVYEEEKVKALYHCGQWETICEKD